MTNVSKAHVIRVLTVGLLFLAGCAGTQGGNSLKVYTSPHGNFEVPVPAMGLFGGTTVQDNVHDDGGIASFHDDIGNLKSITYLRLPPTSGEVLADPPRREAAIRGFLHDYAMPMLFEPVSPETEIVVEEVVGPPGESEYFAVVRIPGGSTLEDANTGRRLDSTRALLVFPRGGYMYMLGYAGGIMNSQSVDEFVITSKEALERFRATIRFDQEAQSD